MILKYQRDVKMKGFVALDMYIIDHLLRKQPINCDGMWMTCLKHAMTAYVELCKGLSGEIGLLIENDTYR